MFGSMFLTLPERAIWLLVVLLGAAWAIPWGWRCSPSVKVPKTKPRSMSRLERLALYVRRSERSSWSRISLAFLLRQHAAELLALKEGLTLEEAYARLYQRAWPRDPVAQAVLLGEDREKGFSERFAHTLALLEGELQWI